MFGLARAADSIAQISEETFDPKSFPYPIVTVPGAQALETWKSIVAEGKGTPVIVGTNYSVNRLLVAFEPLPGESLQPIGAILKGADAVAWPADILAKAEREKADLLAHPERVTDSPVFILNTETGETRKQTKEEAQAELKAIAEGPPLGDWPETVKPEQGLSLLFDFGTENVSKAVHIAIVPTNDPTEAPAYLRYGDWNGCPKPEFHVAALRSWRQRYGARLVAIGFDTIDVAVERQPATRNEAISLAREIYAYCPDNIDQGVGTLSNLAALMMASSWWSFWWD